MQKKDVRLSPKQKEIIKKMQEGKDIHVNCFSYNIYFSKSGESVNEKTLDALIDRDLVTYSHYGHGANIYILTPLGREVKI